MALGRGIGVENVENTGAGATVLFWTPVPERYLYAWE